MNKRTAFSAAGESFTAQRCTDIDTFHSSQGGTACDVTDSPIIVTPVEVCTGSACL